jgi:hypothetical protein
MLVGSRHSCDISFCEITLPSGTTSCATLILRTCERKAWALSRRTENMALLDGEACHWTVQRLQEMSSNISRLGADIANQGDYAWLE